MTRPPSSPTSAIGITGGIGSGKSYLCRRLAAAGIPIFYCDDEAKHLISTDPELQQQLSVLVGSDLLPGDRFRKDRLREYLCKSPAHAGRVNAIVHPRVASAFLRWRAAMEGQASSLAMECALLFEAGFDRLVDLTLLVTAPLDLRIDRVMRRDGVDRDTVERWIALQMSDEERLRRADIIYDNSPRATHPLQGDADKLPPALRRALAGPVGIGG